MLLVGSADVGGGDFAPVGEGVYMLKGEVGKYDRSSDKRENVVF